MPMLFAVSEVVQNSNGPGFLIGELDVGLLLASLDCCFHADGHALALVEDRLVALCQQGSLKQHLEGVLKVK